MALINTERLTELIQLLPERRFAQLCNDLLSTAAAAQGASRAHLDLTLNTSEPEGGLDARAENVQTAVGRLIPEGDSGYQYKSGRQKKSAARLARQDIAEKPRVVELLRNGGTFIYIAGWDRASKIESEVRREAQKLGIEVEPNQFVFITSHTLAQLLQAYPAIIARFFDFSHDLLTIDQVLAHVRLANPYCTDEVLTAQLAGFRAMIEQGEPLRIVGAPGDGKTRFVLEALRGSGLGPTTLYAPQRENVTTGLASYLRSTPDALCTLVVDETDDREWEELQLLFTGMPPGIRLVAIGQDAGPPASRTVRIQGLSEDLLVEAIIAIAVGLEPDVAREIARVCHNSPKLAVLIANRIAENPALAAPRRLLADGDIQRTLDRYLGIPQNDETWEALSVFSLLQRVGWTDEMEHESEILFNALDIDIRRARRLIEDVHRRIGIAPVAGRFRYLSPAILGDYLAARQLGAWPQSTLRSFMQNLTPPMARSFGLRVRRMVEVLDNRRVVEDAVLGNEGPFRRLSDLRQGGLASLLPTFAALFPQATLVCLQRLINAASDDELLEETRARRTLVEALTDLLWRSDTFSGAALLLLRLAANENETWGNNATGTWTETFQVQLGRTAAGPEARLRVLRTAATSARSAERRLAATALGQACRVSGLSRSGMPPRDVEGMPAEAWRPSTWGEWFGVLRSYFRLLGQLLSDSDASVAIEAAKALRTGIRAATRFPVTSDWIEAARLAIGAEYSVRSELMAAIEDETKRHEYRIKKPSDAVDGDVPRPPDPEQLRVAEERLSELTLLVVQLRGDDFSPRFRWAVQRDPIWFRHADFSEAAREKDQELRSLMKEVVANPAFLDDEWEWLATQQRDFGRWAHSLGVVDRERKLAATILNHAVELPIGRRWLAEYEMGYASGIEDDHWLDERLTELHAQGVEGPILLELLYRAEASPDRFNLLVRLFESGSLQGEVLSRFAYTNWTQQDSDTVLHLLEVATRHNTPQAIAAAIQFLAVLLRRGGSWSEPLSDFALHLIQSSTDPNVTQREADDWALVALRVVERDSYGVARATIQQLSNSSLRDEDELLPVLKRAWEVGDKQTLFAELIAPAVLALDERGWRIRDRLEHFDLNGLNLEFLAEWIDQDPEIRALVIAEMAGAPLGTPSDLHAMLLERFEAYGVGNAFFGGVISGVHWGAHSQWLQGRREEVARLIDDPRPVIRAWAEDVMRDLDDMISRELRRDEEEFVRWM